MTPAQLTALKADIATNQSANQAAGNHGAIAAYYNTSAGSGFMWRPNISAQEVSNAIVYSEFVALTVSQQNTYGVMVKSGTIDATSANIRSGFSSVFTGTTLSNLTALAQKVPTHFEALFNVTNVCPVFGQTVSANDIADAITKG
jgi:hypothetical protein